ncbi:hypothetical protein K7432_016772 [Basidiobolus ranarum]|uniref:Uncharacterized protein n=1 Tax=Basidiobolus ranarum TaxID=34480 RepID=A0ABR2WE87_9FUNG
MNCYQDEDELVTKGDSDEITIFNITANSDEVTKFISLGVVPTKEEPIPTNSTTVKDITKINPQVKSAIQVELTKTNTRINDTPEPDPHDHNPSPNVEILDQDYGTTWAYKVAKALLMNQFT